MAHHHDPGAAALAVKEADRELRAEHHVRSRHRTEVYAAGRILLSALFIASGAVKWVHYGSTMQAMAEAGFSDVSMLLPFVIAIELGGGLLLALGWQTRRVAAVLVGYVALITFLVDHDLSLDVNRAQALCNLAFIGALLMVVGHGSGPASLDRYFEHRRKLRTM